MYQLKPAAIKKMVKKEMEEKLDHLVIASPWSKHLVNELFRPALHRLNDCNDYESLDDFISDFYRMSLNEWIESL